MKFERKELIETIFFIALIVLLIIYWEPIIRLSTNVNELREFILRFGIFSSIIFILFAVIQVIIPPIPGQIAGLAGGYLYGVFLGTFYTMIGLVIGSYIIFATSRKYGRPFIEKIVSKERLKKFDYIFSNKGAIILFVFLLIPIFPDDILCYLAGLTRIKMRNLMLINAIGRFPKYLVFNLIGSGLYAKNLVLVISLSIAMIIISLVVYIFRERLKDFIVNFSKRKKKPN